MNDTTIFSVAIVGFGWWGRHIASRLAGHDWMRIAGVVDHDPFAVSAASEQGLRVYTCLSEAVADPLVDGVILTTPTHVHEQQAVQAAQAHKHVFCEKPVSLTAHSARKIVNACRENGVALGVGHERRFEPAMQLLATELQAGDFGTVLHAEAAFSHDKLVGLDINNWRTQADLSPAAGMTAMGVHLTDLFIYLFGKVQAVQAITTRRVLAWETGDVATVQLIFELGNTATLSAISCTPHFVRMHVFGSHKWTQVCNTSHPEDTNNRAIIESLEAGKERKVTEQHWQDAVMTNLEAFGRSALHGEAYPIADWQIIHNIEVLEAIVVSASVRQTIYLDHAQN